MPGKGFLRIFCNVSKILRRIHTACILIAAVSAPTLLNASVVIRQNILELTQASGKIVEGVVVSKEYAQLPFSGLTTIVHLAVNDSIKGESEKSVSFRLPGGRLNGMVSAVAGSPEFFIGESVIVFLEGSDGQIVTGLAQGKFTIEKTLDGEVAIQNTSDLSLLDAKGPSPKEQGGPVTNWEKKFSTAAVTKTAFLTAGIESGTSSPASGRVMSRGGQLRVPLGTLKQTIRECMSLTSEKHSSIERGEQ